MKVKDVMTTNPVVVNGRTPVDTVRNIFDKKRIWGIFVENQGQYVGVITRADLKSRGRSKTKAPAFSIMTKGVLSIDENSDIGEAMQVLCNNNINGLAVTRNGSYCGIVTRSDILNTKNLPILPADVADLIDIVRNHPDKRYDALCQLRKIGEKSAIPLFIERLEDPSERIRYVSILATGEFGDESAIKPLKNLVAEYDYSYLNVKKPGGRGWRTNWGKKENVEAAENSLRQIQQRTGGKTNPVFSQDPYSEAELKPPRPQKDASSATGSRVTIKELYLCGELLNKSLNDGDLINAFKYANDFTNYTKGNLNSEIKEYLTQLEMRIGSGRPELPDELRHKGNILVHQALMEFTD